MTEVHVRRTRSAPVDRDQVWAMLADFDRISEWAPKVTHSTLTAEAADADGGLGMARRVQVGRQALIETVTTWSPPGTIAYRIDGLPPIVAGVTNRWTLSPSREGTFIELTSIIDTGGTRRGRAASRVLSRVLAKASDGMLDGLLSHLADRPANEDRP